MKKFSLLFIILAASCILFTGCKDAKPETPGSDTAASEAGENNEAIEEIFASFFRDEAKVTVGEEISLGYRDYNREYTGKEFTFSEMSDIITAGQPQNAPEPQIRYYKLSRANGTVLLLNYSGLKDSESGPDYTSCFVIAVKNGKPVITYSVDAGYRSDADINSAGVISAGGSAGAGDHIAELGYINADGEYRSIYFAEECYTGWINALFSYCRNDIFSNKTKELAQQADSSGEENNVALYVIGDSVYGVVNANESGSLNGLLESAAADGLHVVTVDELDDAAMAYAETLGMSSSELDAPSIEWLDIK